jgi:hypothetical protein
LCLEQVHTSGNGVQRLDNFPIKIDKIEKTERNNPFYQIELPPIFLCGDEQQYDPYYYQQECQDEEKGFQFHGLIL